MQHCGRIDFLGNAPRIVQKAGYWGQIVCSNVSDQDKRISEVLLILSAAEIRSCQADSLQQTVQQALSRLC